MNEKKALGCPLCKRKMIAITMGILFGLLCVTFANSSSEESIWGTALMWVIIFNRFLVGYVVFIIGVFTACPVTKIKLYPWLRGSLVGAIVSLDMAIGVFVSPAPSEEQKMIFWSTIIVGAIYGMIIDIVATKFGGEGEKLLTCDKK